MFKVALLGNRFLFNNFQHSFIYPSNESTDTSPRMSLRTTRFLPKKSLLENNDLEKMKTNTLCRWACKSQVAHFGERKLLYNLMC